MICPPCKAAGEMNRIANQSVSDGMRAEYQQIAREQHGKCAYPQNCPCHHKVGDVLPLEGKK